MFWGSASFHQHDGNADVPHNVRYSPVLNPEEGFGVAVKDAVCNWLYDTLLDLEEAIATRLRLLLHGGAVHRHIHEWMAP